MAGIELNAIVGLRCRRMYFAYEAPHQKLAWEACSEPAVIETFERLWETKELISSFDGMDISLPRRIASLVCSSTRQHRLDALACGNVAKDLTPFCWSPSVNPIAEGGYQPQSSSKSIPTPRKAPTAHSGYLVLSPL